MILLPTATETTVAAAGYSPRYRFSRLNQPLPFVLRNRSNNHDDSMTCCCLPPLIPPHRHRQRSSRPSHWAYNSRTALFSSAADDDGHDTEGNHFDFRTYNREKQKYGLNLLETLVRQQAAASSLPAATSPSSSPSHSFDANDDDTTTKIPAARLICSIPSTTVIDQSTSKILKGLWKRQNNSAWIDSDDSSRSTSINNSNSNNDQTYTKERNEEDLEDCLVFGPCQLHGGRSQKIHRIHPEIDPLITTTFRSVQQSMKLFGYSTELTRYDLFHGHIFEQRNLKLDVFSSISSSTNTTTTIALLGILFHCAEYPAVFPLPMNETLTRSTTLPTAVAPSGPYHDSSNQNDKKQNEQSTDEITTLTTLGYCQDGSTCHPSLEEWRFRNVLWTCWWHVTSEDDDDDDDMATNKKVVDLPTW
mmetsp:Transcript_49575/g.120292  ORF Transcript_49575/g.120292 Transcript_49575/m.120292 type:complete len:418 (-) Transcript_49575:78-1331(-)